MKSFRGLSYLAARFTLVFTTLTSAGSTFSTGRIPVLLGLFTSEGCCSCPPADRLLASLDEKQPEARAKLIVLGEHVDYFNNLGWQDPFSDKEFTDRQESFFGTLHSEGVYTPQLVVDGPFGFVGSDQAAASAAIRKTLQEPKLPLNISGGTRVEGQITVRVESPGDRSIKTAHGRLFVAVAEEQSNSRSHEERTGADCYDMSPWCGFSNPRAQLISTSLPQRRSRSRFSRIGGRTVCGSWCSFKTPFLDTCWASRYRRLNPKETHPLSHLVQGTARLVGCHASAETAS